MLHRGTSLIRNCNFLGPYRRTIPRVLRWSQGVWLFLMSEVPLEQESVVGMPYTPPCCSACYISRGSRPAQAAVEPTRHI